MTYRRLVLAALLASVPAWAGVVEFRGHSIATDDADGGRLVEMRSARYSIPGSTAQVVAKVQACLGRAESGAGIVAVDAASGRLRAVSRSAYRHDGESRLLRSRWLVEAGEGSLQVAFSDLADIRGDGVDETYVPLQLRGDAGWEQALAALIAVEQGLLDCMYR